MASVYTATGNWRVERAIYRIVGVQPHDRQRWTKYLSSLLAFSAVSVLALYGILLLQAYLPQPWGHKGMTPALAFNTAISFTTNTSWQNYPGESTLGHVGLAAGLGVQAFASCAVGMCVAVALTRGLAQYQKEEIGNFWVDLVRTVVRVLVPFVDHCHASAGRAWRRQQLQCRAGGFDPGWRQPDDSRRSGGRVGVDQADVG